MRQVDIEGFEDYQITDDGRVWSKKSNKYLTPLKGRYYSVHLSKDGVTYTKSIHRLVAEAFVNNESNLPVVDHIDGNPHNNIAENLRWCTIQSNNSTEIARERKSQALRGRIPTEAITQHTQNTSHKIYQYSLDGELVATYDSIREASRQTNFTFSGIRHCCEGSYYSHLRKKYYICNEYKGYKWSYQPL